MEGACVLVAQGGDLLFHPDLHFLRAHVSILLLQGFVFLVLPDFSLVAGYFQDLHPVDVAVLGLHFAGDVVQFLEPDAVEEDLPVLQGVHDLAEVNAQGYLVVELVDVQDLADGGLLQEGVLEDGLEEFPVGDVELLAVQGIHFFFLHDVALLCVFHLLHLEGVVQPDGEGARLHAGVQLVGQSAVLQFQDLHFPLQFPVLLHLFDEGLLALHQAVLQPAVQRLEGEEGENEGDGVRKDDREARDDPRKEQEEGDIGRHKQEAARDPEGVLDAAALVQGIFENLISGLAHRGGKHYLSLQRYTFSEQSL